MKSDDNSLKSLRILVAVDFSDCCNQALKRVVGLFKPRPMELVLLHVIDERLISEFIKHCSDNDAEIKKSIFTDAGKKLDVLAKEEPLTGFVLRKIVCQGIPYREINRQAKKFDVDFIVMGSCGMAGDPEAIFFGGTTERVMRFITRPVFCFPPQIEKKNEKKLMSSNY